jgi:hypothetical protein
MQYLILFHVSVMPCPIYGLQVAKILDAKKNFSFPKNLQSHNRMLKEVTFKVFKQPTWACAHIRAWFAATNNKCVLASTMCSNIIII